MSLAVLGHGSSWVDPQWWPAAWMGQAAFVLLGTLHSPRTAFGLSLLASLVLHIWVLNWAPEVLGSRLDAPLWLSWLAFGMIVLWESLAIALFGTVVSWVTRDGVRRLWLIPVAWVVMEYWWPRVFPWLLGHTQLAALPMIQIAELTGPVGIGFYLTAVAVWPAGWLLNRQHVGQSKWFYAYVASTALLLLFVLGFGFVQLRVWGHPASDEPLLTVGILQGEVGGRSSHVHLLERTRRMANHVDLVCWPETSLGTYRKDLKSFSDPEITLYWSRNSQHCLRPTENAGCPVLAAGQTYPDRAPDLGPYAVSAFLIDRDESVRGVYHKRSLMPFGEYIPGQQYFAVLYLWASRLTKIEPGTSAQPLVGAEGARLGVLICFEDMLPENARQTASAGAQVLIALVNGESFHSHAALDLHRRLALLRAVENRRYFLRCASTGVTCVITPTGEVLAELPKDVEGELLAKVALQDQQTIYTRFGNWLPYSCTALLCMALLLQTRFRKTAQPAA
jgi:apolipoprotein N-acyltransferase